MEACILIGGSSSRMGWEKPLTPWGGGTIIDSLLSKVKDITDHIYLITNKNNISLYVKYVSDSVSVIQDQIEDIGPLGGIHAGLNEIRGNEAFFLASDLPFLSVKLLKELKTTFRTDPGSEVVVCKTRAGIEPLVAIYSKQTLPVLNGQVENCKLNIRSFLEKVNTRYYECLSREKEFYNLNEPKDVEGIGEKVG